MQSDNSFKMIFNRFSLNALLISIFIFNVSSLESENKTIFYETNDKNFIQNLLRDSLQKKDFEVNNKNNNNNQSFNESFAENNQLLSEILLNKNLNDSQSNSSLFLKQLIEEIHKNDPNVSVSESRTLSSWLGLNRFRRPQFKIKPFQGTAPTQDQPPPIPPIPPQLPFPQFLNQPGSFPGPHDPESMLVPPSLFEETGIKYWLKFIENAGKDQSQESEEFDSRPESSVESSRKRRPNYKSNSRLKLDIGEKPNDDNNDYYEEDDEEENDERHHKHHNHHNHHQEEDDEPNDDDTKSSGSGSTTATKSKQTYDTSPRCDKFTSDICVDDFEYPEQAIVDEIYKRRELFELMYSEVRDNLPLVDGIPRDVEESYNYDYYYDNKDPHPSSSGGAEKKSVSPGKGFVCPSEVMYGKPKLARNKKGDWKVIVNAAEFTQTVRMEKCLKPNSKCNYISYGDFDSRCAQVHSYHRLLVFEKGKGFYIDTFRIPTACTCHVTRRVSYKPLPSHSTRFHKKKKPSPPLSNTLWSILGGPPPSEGLPMSASQEMVRNQINLLQQLKHFPQLSHITPDNVFQQLMDFQPNSGGMLSSGFSPQKTYQNPQKPNFGQSSGMDYMLPSLMFNEEQNDRKSHSQMSRPFAQIQQTPGTTTVLNPNSNGAPVVQVIHVPVTSQMAHNPDPAPVYKGKHPTFNDYTYLDASSLFYKPKQNSEEFLHTFGDNFSQFSVNNFKPLMLGMSSKTNSSLMSPNSEKDPIKRQSETVDTKNNSDSDETNQKRKVMVENTLNKKINFSYHPILEYISK